MTTDNLRAAAHALAEARANRTPIAAPAAHFGLTGLDDAYRVLAGDRIDDIVTSALLATRPNADGRFAIPDFETLHRNLAAAYPASAEAAKILIQEIAA